MTAPLTKEEITALIDQKIKEHEIRIGIISGIVGVLLIAGLSYFLSIVYLATIK